MAHCDRGAHSAARPRQKRSSLRRARAPPPSPPLLFDASRVLQHRVAAIIPGQWAIETKPSIALHVIFHCPTRRGRRGVASRSQHRCHRKYPDPVVVGRYTRTFFFFFVRLHGSLVLYPILIRMEHFFFLREW